MTHLLLLACLVVRLEVVVGGSLGLGLGTPTREGLLSGAGGFGSTTALVPGEGGEGEEGEDEGFGVVVDMNRVSLEMRAKEVGGGSMKGKEKEKEGSEGSGELVEKEV